MYEKHSFYVDPKSYKIGDDVKDETSVTSASGVHISLKSTLKNFLETPGILKEVKTYIRPLEEQPRLSCDARKTVETEI